MSRPPWKLKVRQRDRWHGPLAFLGWRWEWEVRTLWNDGYYPADLFDWKGLCRTEESARAAAERAYKRLAHRPQEPEWAEWYIDENGRAHY